MTVSSVLPALALSLSVSSSVEPLEGCDATPVRYGWRYECADLRATANDRPETGGEVERFVRTMVEAARTSVGDGASVRREERHLAGSKADVFVVGREALAVFVVALRLEQGTRVLHCRGGEARCTAVVRTLAATAWRGDTAPGSIRKDPPPLVIRGRAVAVPEGCRSTSSAGSGAITCGPGDRVNWGWTDDAGADEVRPTFETAMRGLAQRLGLNGAEAEVPCRIGGVDTSCTRMLGTSPRGRLLLLWGKVPDGRGITMVSCMKSGATPGRACELVFEIPQVQ